MDEQEAISRLKRGDISGLETLVRTYQLRATRAAYLIVHNSQQAEDIVEDAFLRAYERINQFDSGRPFGPWFFRMVINIAQRTATQRERQISLDSMIADADMALEDVLADMTPGPEELVEKADIHMAVWAALRKLTPMQRATVVQRYFLDMSENEIATDLDCPPGTIKWRLHTARARLREWLRPLWGADSQ